MRLIVVGEGAVSGTVDAISFRFPAVAVDDDQVMDGRRRVIVMQRVRLLVCSLQCTRSGSDTLSSQQEDKNVSPAVVSWGV